MEATRGLAIRALAKLQDREPRPDLLLRLFESEWFTEWMCLQYLYQSHTQPGVEDYLCNRLLQLKEGDVERYLLQLVYLAVSRPGSALERTIVALCGRSFSIAIKVHWLLLALSQDQTKSKHVEQLKDACERAALEGYWEVPFRGSQLDLHHLESVMSPATSIQLSGASPLVLSPITQAPLNITMGTSPSTERPLPPLAAPGILPKIEEGSQELSAHGAGLQLGIAATRPRPPSREGSAGPPSQLVVRPGSAETGLGTAAPVAEPGVPLPGLAVHTRPRRSGSSGGTSVSSSAQQQQSQTQQSGEPPQLGSPFQSHLRRHIQDIHDQLGDGEGVTALLHRSVVSGAVAVAEDESGLLSDDDVAGGGPVNGQGGTPLSPTTRLRHETYCATLDFMDTLCEASNSLAIISQEERVRALRHTLEAMNKELAKGLRRGIAVWYPLGRRDERVLRIPAKEAVLLNSREKAPFLLVLEVLRNEDEDEDEEEEEGKAEAEKGREEATDHLEDTTGRDGPGPPTPPHPPSPHYCKGAPGASASPSTAPSTPTRGETPAGQQQQAPSPDEAQLQDQDASRAAAAAVAPPPACLAVQSPRLPPLATGNGVVGTGSALLGVYSPARPPSPPPEEPSLAQAMAAPLTAAFEAVSTAFRTRLGSPSPPPDTVNPSGTGTSALLSVPALWAAAAAAVSPRAADLMAASAAGANGGPDPPLPPTPSTPGSMMSAVERTLLSTNSGVSVSSVLVGSASASAVVIPSRRRHTGEDCSGGAAAMLVHTPRSSAMSHAPSEQGLGGASAAAQVQRPRGGGILSAAEVAAAGVSPDFGGVLGADQPDGDDDDCDSRMPSGSTVSGGTMHVLNGRSPGGEAEAAGSKYAHSSSPPAPTATAEPSLWTTALNSFRGLLPSNNGPGSGGGAVAPRAESAPGHPEPTAGARAPMPSSQSVSAPWRLAAPPPQGGRGSLTAQDVAELVSCGALPPPPAPPRPAGPAADMGRKMSDALASLRGDAPLVRLRIRVLPQPEAAAAPGATSPPPAGARADGGPPGRSSSPLLGTLSSALSSSANGPGSDGAESSSSSLLGAGPKALSLLSKIGLRARLSGEEGSGTNTLSLQGSTGSEVGSSIIRRAVAAAAGKPAPPAPKLLSVALEVAGGVNLAIVSPYRKSRRTPSHEAISMVATRLQITQLPPPPELGPPLPVPGGGRVEEGDDWEEEDEVGAMGDVPANAHHPSHLLHPRQQSAELYSVLSFSSALPAAGSAALGGAGSSELRSGSPAMAQAPASSPVVTSPRQPDDVPISPSAQSPSRTWHRPGPSAFQAAAGSLPPTPPSLSLFPHALPAVDCPSPTMLPPPLPPHTNVGGLPMLGGVVSAAAAAQPGVLSPAASAVPAASLPRGLSLPSDSPAQPAAAIASTADGQGVGPASLMALSGPAVTGHNGTVVPGMTPGSGKPPVASTPGSGGATAPSAASAWAAAVTSKAKALVAALPKLDLEVGKAEPSTPITKLKSLQPMSQASSLGPASSFSDQLQQAAAAAAAAAGGGGGGASSIGGSPPPSLATLMSGCVPATTMTTAADSAAPVDGSACDPAAEKRRRDAWGVYGERWASRCQRVRRESPHGARKGWALRCVIVKSGDDCRQEQLAVQLIRTFADIFHEAALPLWVRPYEVLVTSNKTALIEVVPDAPSIHTLKHRSPPGASLSDHFFAKWPHGTPECTKAQRKFTESLAAYSIICYLLQIKDRHNGNILLDDEGHLVHIDFGFMLSNSPGGVNFEAAPFKLTRELLEVMDSNSEGRPSELFDYFKVLMIQGFLACRKHHERLLLLVRMMARSGLPCFKTGERAVKALEKRLCLGLTEVQVMQAVLSLISDSLDAWRTRQYDYYQRLLNGIL